MDSRMTNAMGHGTTGVSRRLWKSGMKKFGGIYGLMILFLMRMTFGFHLRKRRVSGYTVSPSL